MRLPSGEKVGLVDIRYHNPASDTVNCVSLPTSRHFSAIPTGFPVSRRFEIFRLNWARVDGVGRVQLEDQIELRALEVEPARLPVRRAILIGGSFTSLSNSSMPEIATAVCAKGFPSISIIWFQMSVFSMWQGFRGWPCRL